MTSINILKMLSDNLDIEIEGKEVEATLLTEQLAKLDSDITKLRSMKRLLLVKENGINQQQEDQSKRE